jgi:UbiD family decarboxylase
MPERSFADLRSFLDELRARGELAVVDAPVDPELEVAEIHRRVIAAGGPALLFTSVRGAELALATNLFGTAARAQLAFGSRPRRLVEEAVRAIETLMPPSAAGLWGARELLAAALQTGLRTVRRGPVLDVVSRSPDLRRLPVLRSWPEDGGPFITWPLVYTEHPEGGRQNLGVYRLQVHGPAETGMHWQIGKGGGFHHAAAAEQGVELPVTVFLGGPPAMTLAAVAPLPENVPELLLASLIAGRRIPRCQGPGPHPLVATVEIAFGGRVPPYRRRPEGPFGDHYGYYSLRHDYPVLEVDWLARRHDAICPATVVGKPRQEDFYIGDLLQELLAPLFPLVMPGVRSLWSYGETGYHSLAAAVVRERYRREAMSSAFRILGEGQLGLTKLLLLTDRPVDLRDVRATLEHLLARTRTETDLYVISNLSMDSLDYTGPEPSLGSKGVWLGLGDELRPLPREFRDAELPSGVETVEVFCAGCLVVNGPPHDRDPGFAARLAAAPELRPWPLIVLCDRPREACASVARFLWTTFTRFEPAADIHAAATRVVRHHLSYTAPIVIDARLKAWYPKELAADPETAALVSRRWREYFPAGGVEMGDSERAHLG